MIFLHYGRNVSANKESKIVEFRQGNEVANSDTKGDDRLALVVFLELTLLIGGRKYFVYVV